MSDSQGAPSPESTAPPLHGPESPPPPDTEGERVGTDASLDKLDTRLSAALGDLLQQNRQVEDYLEYLAQERRRELRSTDADQLTLDDIPAEHAEEGPDSSASGT